MQKKTIYIRVDGDSGRYSGLGHIYRSLTLYKNLKKILKNFKFVFLSKYSLGVKIIKKNTKEKIIKYSLNNVSKLKFNKDDIFIIDTLGADKSLLKFLNKLKVKKISFDETNIKLFKTGIVINGIYFAKKKIQKNNKVKIFQSPKYIILNEDYSQKTKIKDFDVSNLIAIVCCGGADYNNFLYNISSKIVNSKIKKIYVVIGKAVKKDNKIFKFTSKKINKIMNMHPLKKIIMKSDLVICSGGTIMFEALSQGKKPHVFQDVTNQKYAINFFNKKKIIKNYQKPTLKNIFKLKKNIERIKKYDCTLIKKHQNLVDGKGLNRCVKIISKYVN